MSDIWEFRYRRLERLFELLSDLSPDYLGRVESALRFAIETFSGGFAAIGHPDRGLYVFDHFVCQHNLPENALRAKWNHAASKHLDNIEEVTVCSNVPAQNEFRCDERNCGLGAFIAVNLQIGERKWLLMVGALEPRASNYTESDRMLMESLAEFFLRVLTLRESRERIANRAYYDPLTRAVNRQGLIEHFNASIAAALRSGHRGAILFLDLNGFKEVNDTYGHKAGDTVLLEFADRVRSVLRAEDFFARLGGDEFAVIVPHVRTPRDVSELTRRIHGVLRDPFKVGKAAASIGAAIGAAYFPDQGRTSAELLAVADAEMYKSKQAMKLERQGR